MAQRKTKTDILQKKINQSSQDHQQRQKVLNNKVNVQTKKYNRTQKK